MKFEIELVQNQGATTDPLERIVRHVINMDGMTHGPLGSNADCLIDSEKAVSANEGMRCGSRCGKCRVGIIHWQSVYGGYFY